MVIQDDNKFKNTSFKHLDFGEKFDNSKYIKFYFKGISHFWNEIDGIIQKYHINKTLSKLLTRNS